MKPNTKEQEMDNLISESTKRLRLSKFFLIFGLFLMVFSIYGIYCYFYFGIELELLYVVPYTWLFYLSVIITAHGVLLRRFVTSTPQVKMIYYIITGICLIAAFVTPYLLLGILR